MTKSELNKYFEEKKWCQVLEILYKNKDLDATISFIKLNVDKLVQKTHLPTFSKILSKICDLKPDLELFSMVDTEITSSDFKTHEQEDFMIINKINIDMLKLGELEAKVYEYKSNKYSKEVNKRLNRLYYIYYESINDLEKAYETLKAYLDTKPEYDDKKQLCNKLAYYALMSNDIYVFDDVMKYIDDIDNKDLVIAYSQGNIDYVAKNAHPGGFSIEKVYVVAFLKMCNSKKDLSLDIISTKLYLDYDNTVKLVLKALGKGLVRGHIDGENKVFKVHSVVSSVLDDEEIRTMKEKFYRWRMRIRSVIKTM